MKKTNVFMATVAALGLMAVPAGAAMTDRAQEECAAAPDQVDEREEYIRYAERFRIDKCIDKMEEMFADAVAGRHREQTC